MPKIKSKSTKMTLRKSMISAGLALALQLFWHSDAVAQRTAEGSTFLGVSPTVSAYSVPSGGLDICTGGYLRSSLWKTGVRAIDWNHRIASDTGVGHDDLFDHIAWSLYGGWRYRLFGTYNRVLSVYGGGDVFLGINQYEAFRRLPSELKTGLPKSQFIYGVLPELEAEFFVGRCVALTLGAQLPVTLGSSLKSDKWNLTGSIGVRINLLKR